MRIETTGRCLEGSGRPFIVYVNSNYKVELGYKKLELDQNTHLPGVVEECTRRVHQFCPEREEYERAPFVPSLLYQMSTNS